MTAKNYLRQIRLLDQKISQRVEEAAELRQLAIGFHAVEIKEDAVQTSPDGDKLAEAVGRYVDMEEEIDRMIDDFVDLKHKIIGEIQGLSDQRMVELLYLRYVKYMRLEEIACTMKKADGTAYSYEHIRWLHGISLRKFAESYSFLTS